MTMDQTLQKRNHMVLDAKTKRPTAAFYVGLVRISQAIDMVKEGRVAEDHLDAVVVDVELRYKAERDGK